MKLFYPLIIFTTLKTKWIVLQRSNVTFSLMLNKIEGVGKTCFHWHSYHFQYCKYHSFIWEPANIYSWHKTEIVLNRLVKLVSQQVRSGLSNTHIPWSQISYWNFFMLRNFCPSDSFVLCLFGGISIEFIIFIVGTMDIER